MKTFVLVSKVWVNGPSSRTNVTGTEVGGIVSSHVTNWVDPLNPGSGPLTILGSQLITF